MPAIIPASIRNNNPGAQYPGRSSRKFGSTVTEILKSKDGQHKIARFPTKVHGGAALFDLLDRVYAGMTLDAAITKWCGGFYAQTYLGVLESRAGVSRTEMLSKAFLRDRDRAIRLAKAMAWQEAGREYPMSDDEWIAAHDMAFQAPVAPGFAPDNDVPSPRPETRMAETVKQAAVPAAVATGATGAGVGAVAAPPDLSWLVGWQSAGDAIKNTVLWGASSWPWLVAAGVAYLIIGHALPALARWRG